MPGISVTIGGDKFCAEYCGVNLKTFCHQNPSMTRHAGTIRPQIFGGWMYATNGRVAIRVPTDLGDTVQAMPEKNAFHVIDTYGDTFPMITKVAWEDAEAVYDWQPWPTAFSFNLGEECNFCEWHECPKCDGEGTCSHCEQDCQKCEGTGEVKADGQCKFCYRQPMGKRPVSISLGGEMLGGLVVRLIDLLPNLRWCISDRPNVTGEKLFLFRFGDAGQGVAMPLMKSGK